jgi:hypothetical protein
MLDIKLPLQAHLTVKQHVVELMPGAYPEDQTVKATSSLGWDHVLRNLFLVGHLLSEAFAFCV